MGLIIKKAAAYPLEETRDNDFFASYLDTSDAWIVKRTGIRQRYVACVPLHEMAVGCARNLNLTPEEKEKIKLLIVSTIGGEAVIPALSAIVQGRLGLSNEILALDLNMACAGFVGATVLAEPYLKAGEMALVIGAEKLSDYVNYEDRSTAILFGDGAGCALYEKDDRPFYKDTGCIGDNLALTLERSGKIGMNGREVFKFAIDRIPKSIARVAEALYREEGREADFYVLHQANGRITRSIQKHFKGVFYSNVEEVANTSSASCGLVLSELFEAGRLKGKTVILSGFGGGLNFASCVIRGDYETK